MSVEDIKVLLTQENPFLSKLEEDAHAQAKKMGMHGKRFSSQSISIRAKYSPSEKWSSVINITSDLTATDFFDTDK